MSIWSQIRGVLTNGPTGGYRSEASIDLDVLENHADASKLLVGIDMSRLERLNRDRRAKPHEGFGVVSVDDGNLRWDAARAERSCGVRNIQLNKDQLRSVDIQVGSVTAVLADGTNLVFVVNVRTTPTRRSRPSIRHQPQEPPLIS